MAIAMYCNLRLPTLCQSFCTLISMPAMNQPTTILQGIFLQFMSIYQYFGPTCTVTKNRQRAGFIAGLLVVITEARPRSKMLALSLRLGLISLFGMCMSMKWNVTFFDFCPQLAQAWVRPSPKTPVRPHYKHSFQRALAYIPFPTPFLSPLLTLKVWNC